MYCAGVKMSMRFDVVLLRFVIVAWVLAAGVGGRWKLIAADCANRINLGLSIQGEAGKVAGYWNLIMTPSRLKLRVTLELHGNRWAGRIVVPEYDMDYPLTDIRVEGEKLSFNAPTDFGTYVFSGRVASGKFEGTCEEPDTRTQSKVSGTFEPFPKGAACCLLPDPDTGGNQAPASSQTTVTAQTTRRPASGAASPLGRGVLKVHGDHVIQPEYLGANAVYHGFAFMPEQELRGMNDQDRAREFDRVARMGLNIARTWYRPDWTSGGSLANAPDWESPRMRAFYRWLAAMRERNVDVALQGGWWFTRDTYLGSPSPDPARDFDRYPRWVSDSVHEIVEVRGFRNVRYLLLFTEPTVYKSGLIPAGETQWSYYEKMARAIDHRLRADGRRGLVKLVGPNAAGGFHLKDAVADLNDVIDIYSGHTYNKPGYDEWFAFCRKMADTVAPTGKPLWLDEMGMSMGKSGEAYRRTGAYGTYLAQIIAASINASLQTSLQWLLFDQLYVAPGDNTTNNDSFHHGVQRSGACKWPHDDIEDPSSCYPQWGAVSLLSKYLGGRRGTKTLECESSDTLKVAATSRGPGEISVLVVNTSDSPQEFAIELVNFRSTRPLYRHLYDPGNIAADEEGRAPAVPARFHGNMRDSIPAGGVLIYSTIEP